MLSRIKEEEQYKKEQEYNNIPTPGNNEKNEEDDP